MAVVFLGLALQYASFTRFLDFKLLDAQFSLMRACWPRTSLADVAVVGIDEETMLRLPEPIALWHSHLGRFLEAMASANVRAVGLDIALPESSYDFIVPGSDMALLKGLLAMRRGTPLVLGVTVAADGKPRHIYPPYLALAGEGGAGYLLWPVDADQTVRRFDERQGVGGTAVPTLAGQMARRLGANPQPGLVDYALGSRFNYVPLWQVLDWQASGNGQALHNAFAGRPVLLGSVLPFEDRHKQPVNLAGWEDSGGVAPGVLIHAQALRTLLGPGSIKTVPMPVVLLLALTGAMLLWLAGRRIAVGAALVGAMLVIMPAAATWGLANNWYLPAAGPMLAVVLGFSLRVGTEAWREMAERRLLRRAFSGYVSPHVLREILEGHLADSLGGSRRHVCVLFADIRDFTTLSEALSAEEVIGLLNRYFAYMTAAIHRQEGTVDKFIGDGIMAFFGAPNTVEHPSRRAFAAALDMLEKLKMLNAELAAEGQATIRIGIGLHVGEAVVGHAGSAERHEYTAVGDVVNVSSRIEDLTKPTGYALVCSAAVMDELENSEGFISLGEQPLKGHTPRAVFGWKASRNKEET